MSKFQDPQYLLNEQYHDARRLNARIRLHVEFSTNPYGWFRWVFDHYDLPADARILELGCGPGDLWLEAMGRIPPGWAVTLSDFSPGMVAQVKANLDGQPHPFSFEVIDAQSIPYENGFFDAVIANHCLFHVPDRPKAISEIRRVLKEGSPFYGTTVGEKHLREMPALIARFDPALDEVFSHDQNPFTLESGEPQIRAWFSEVKVHRYPDDLRITNASALVDYVFSTIRVDLPENRREAFTRFVETEMAAGGGEIRIVKDSGLFEAR